MFNLHLYLGTQYLHTCGELTFQDGGQYGRQKALKDLHLSLEVSYKDK